MTGPEFLTYVQSIAKRPDKETEIYESVTDVVMDMRLRMKSEDFKYETVATISTIGDYKLCLPGDFGHIIGDVTVKDTNTDQAYYPLTKISKQAYDDLYSSRILTTVANRNTGCPIHYCLFGGEIFIGPPVDKTSYSFQINYTTEDQDAVDENTTDVPFSDKYRKTVRYGVLKELYLILENYQEAEVWSNLYESDLLKIVRNDEENIKEYMPIQYNGI